MAATENPALVALISTLLLVVGAVAAPAARCAEQDDFQAVVLLYHHVSESTPSLTSVSPQLFESHLDYLARHDFTVLPLTEIVSAVREKRSLPPRSVAITFDDGYQSIVQEALPQLARRSWPFTVFVSTDAIDQGFKGFMSWNDLRRIEAAGGIIANHSKTHDHLVRRQSDESSSAWLHRIESDMRAAEARLDDELEDPARLFAWPYGEFDSKLERLAQSLDYIAFGQQSGPVGAHSSLYSLPRFPMAAGFASLDSFGEKLRSRALPATTLAPDSRVLPVPATPPVLRLRLPDGPYRLDALQCYVQGQEPATIDRKEQEFTITAHTVMRPGRSKFNCTAPAVNGGGVYYWYSHLWLQPNDDGSWYAE